MNFQQLKIIREAARQDYNLTEVANMLFTSQSGVSRHIRELEDELGIEIFVRRGKRLLGMTEPGKALLVIAERILNEASNVRRLADLFTNDTSGVLTIATTHTPLDHPLTQITPLTLESIAKWPLITYRQGITGRSRIDDAFARKGLPADIVLSAQDSDVIKTYVALGLGIGLVAEQSSGEQEEKNLIRLDTRHLFDANTVWLGLKRGQLQRNYVWRFLELCNAGLSVEDIKRQVMENSEEEIDYQI